MYKLYFWDDLNEFYFRFLIALSQTYDVIKSKGALASLTLEMLQYAKLLRQHYRQAVKEKKR